MDIPTASQIECQLRSRRTPDLPDHFILPDYSGHSVANIAPTIARIFDVRLPGSAPPLPKDLWFDLALDVDCVILLLVDAVGYLQLRKYMANEISLFTQLALEGRLLPITSVFPSTTVSALTSIWTGRAPLGHGFVGTKLLLPKQGVLANMLKMAPATYGGGSSLEEWGWEADRFVTAPSLPQRLTAAGVATIAHIPRHFLGSPLTRIFLRGMGDLNGYLDLSDLWINLRTTLKTQPKAQPVFVDVYWSGIDDTGHTYGTEDEYISSALQHLARSLQEDFVSTLGPETRDSTLLIIAADHGQVATPPERVVHLPDHPGLQQTLLLPPAGESRAAYLYARPGQKRALQAYVDAHLGEHFVLLDTERGLEAGLWGQPGEITPGLRARLGDVVLVARTDARLSSRGKEDEGDPLRGHHGSLTPEEMLVPLLMVRLDEL